MKTTLPILCGLLILTPVTLAGNDSIRCEIELNSPQDDAVCAVLMPDRIASKLKNRTMLASDSNSVMPFDICDTLGGNILLFQPGLTSQTKAEYAFTADAPAQKPAKTDLTVTADDKHIIVKNAYFTVWHPKRGGGGFPARIKFEKSGFLEEGLVFEDWVRNSRENITNRARTDAASTTRLVHQSPLGVLLEVSVTFKGTSRQVKGTYQYLYTFASPIVRVWCLLEQDEIHQWNDVRVFVPGKKDFTYQAAVIGSPAGRIAMHPPGHTHKGSINGSDYALMENTEAAIGISSGLGAVAYDNGGDGYYYYVRPSQTLFSTRDHLLAAEMYLGPYQENPDVYTAWFTGRCRLLKSSLQEQDEATDTVVLEDEALKLQFAGGEEGFACIGADNKITGDSFMGVSPRSSGLWALQFKDANGNVKTLTAKDPCVRSIKQMTESGKGVIISWKGLSLDGRSRDVDVEVRVALTSPGRSEWTISLTNRSKRYGLTSYEFPRLSRVAPSGACDLVVPGGCWGARLVRNNRTGHTKSYPNVGCPMQFWAFLTQHGGLYLATEDPNSKIKVFNVSPGNDFTVLTWAEDMARPRKTRTLGYPFVLQAFKGDWWRAADIYRQWAIQQKWCSSGPLASRSDQGGLLADVGIWIRWWQGTQPAEVMDEIVARCRKAFDVPLAFHWYRTYTHNFDWGYPHYPPKPGVAERMRQYNDAGTIMMSYINGRLWDTAEKSFSAARPWACLTANGDLYRESYPKSSVLSVMCPYTKHWHEAIASVVEDQVEEFGASIFYLDQIGAAEAAMCFNPDHGHPVGGGSWWTDGYRTMLARLKSINDIDGRPISLTTENFAEPYLDTVDGFLMTRTRSGEDLPATPAIYGGYGVFFGIHQGENDNLDSFVALHGRDFLWGCQPGWINGWIATSKHAAKAAYLESVAKYRLSMKKFLVFGRLVGQARISPEPDKIRRTCTVSTAFVLETPAVGAYVWKAQDGALGLVCANLTQQDHEVTVEFSAQQVGYPGLTKFSCTEIDAEGNRQPLGDIQGSEVSLQIKLNSNGIKAFELLPLE
jgi:hypothetical protein